MRDKQAINRRNRELYKAKLSSYLYIIKVDKKIYWVGSTNNIKRRIVNHRTGKYGFVERCRNANIDLKNKKVCVYVCSLEEERVNLSKKDLEYYEHTLIRELKALGEPLLNSRVNSKFIKRDRYIDEMLFNIDFKKTNLRII